MPLEIDFLNRRVHLRELKQRLIYEGLLEGLPTVEKNRQRIERVIRAEQDGGYIGTPYVIQPVEKPIDLKGEDPYPFGTPARLPSVVCVARVESYAPTNGQTGDGSGVKVIWFQEEFALPIAEDILRRLRETDWDTCAVSFEY